MRNQAIRAFLLTFMLLAAGLYCGTQAALSAYAAGAEPYAGLDTFARAMTHIQEHYVEERSTGELVYAAIAGMTNALDEQSAYFDPETYAALRDDHEGTTTGIGVLVTGHPQGGVLIQEVLPGGPARLAGLKPGDRIVRVDDQDVLGLSVAEVVALVKGPRGTPITLGIERETQPLEIRLVRDEVLAPSVTGEVFEAGLGYVRIEQFRRDAGGAFRETLARLRKESPTPLRGLILDLRHNPGGLLEEAVVVVDTFVDEGLIVETRGRSGRGTDETIEATAPGTDLDLNVVVLMDPRSASASEIVAGALQDHKRATVVGQPSYGKGSVQTYFEYEDHSALKLTIAKYYLPSGRSLTKGDGITPDDLVLPKLESLDPRAALRARLSDATLDDATRTELLALVDALPRSRPAQPAPPLDGAWAERLAVDPQLQAAVRHLSAE
ncbi:MAG: S41 family peptidase [Alphaproteobacteria bacterium]|nr:S41 family peptidase [Alphaproteobacteria bacterium]